MISYLWTGKGIEKGHDTLSKHLHSDDIGWTHVHSLFWCRPAVQHSRTTKALSILYIWLILYIWRHCGGYYSYAYIICNVYTYACIAYYMLSYCLSFACAHDRGRARVHAPPMRPMLGHAPGAGGAAGPSGGAHKGPPHGPGLVGPGPAHVICIGNHQ